MGTPQPGVFALGTRSHFHLELDVRAGVGDGPLATALGVLHAPSVSAGGLNLVVGFGATLWSRLAPRDVPRDLRPFQAVGDPAARHAPATQHDLWVWLHGPGEDAVLDGARRACAALEEVATIACEVPSFVYRDGRDLTGFVDGTENPPVEGAFAVALVPEPGPDAGGSYALVQQWRHDLRAFDALEVAEQEGVIGRTKADSIELADDVKPPTAHIARVVVEDDEGEELEIYRRSTPYGTVQVHGLQFVAFSADPDRFERMLARMFGVAGDGLHDRLTDFSTPVSGAYYFVPSLESLAALSA
ncbi:MAG TPA: Dyp-type peroxidase [Acidimicrobiales bacterium]|nr:Dyp-type peroxidase [Acidimicrobiales bacterium]